MDGEIYLARLPPKRNAEEFETAVDRPAKARKKSENMDYNYETAMYRASPLDKWLNQSAVPLAVPTSSTQDRENASSEKDSVAKELDELKVFRNVHIATAPEPPQATSLADLSDLDLDTRIYYRNITDRYPLLPEFLAKRLAIANHDRAERLQSQRDAQAEKHLNKKHRCKICDIQFSRPSSLQTHMYSHTGAKRESVSSTFSVIPFDRNLAFACDYPGCERRFSVVSNLRRHMKVHKGDVERSGEDVSPSLFDFTKDFATCDVDQIPTTRFEHTCSETVPPWAPTLDRKTSSLDQERRDRPRKSSLTHLSNVSPVPNDSRNFWTGTESRKGPSSVHSRSSGMNSSLHGYKGFDPEDQYPKFQDEHSRGSSADFQGTSRGLPPFPLGYGTVQDPNEMIQCDLCGCDFLRGSRRHWQWV